jgi:ABC-type multidrug transport system ATPase subunit
MLQQLGLTGEEDPAHLSGGEARRAALARVLAPQPDILLLDEPTTGVDAVSRREFWDLLGRLKQSGLTTVVSTPYMDEATRCDRIALMHRGRLRGVDTPDAITGAFEWPLLGVRASDRYRALLALRRYEHAHSAYPFGDVIHYTDTRIDAAVDAIAADVQAFLTACGFADASVGPLTPTVEDSFIARTEDAA